MIDTYLIVGLGNPGAQYKNTRHNIGFQILDDFASRFQSTFQLKKPFKGHFSSIAFDSFKFKLLKPDTFMNLSGESVLKVSNYYQIPTTQIIVVHDDLDLPFGSIRTRLKGSHGGHNGLKSIMECLSCRDFKRVKVGILNDLLKQIKSGSNDGVKDFVLGNWSASEQKVMEELIQLGYNSIISLVKGEKANTLKLEIESGDAGNEEKKCEDLIEPKENRCKSDSN